MGWAYWNPVRIAFGRGPVRQGRRADRAAGRMRSSPTAVIIPRLAAKLAAAAGAPVVSHRQHRHQSGFAELTESSRRFGAAGPARSDRRARRGLDDRCREGACGKRRRLRRCGRSPDRKPHSMRRNSADHRGADDGRYRQRSHVLGDGVGLPASRNIRSPTRVSIRKPRSSIRADARGAARADARPPASTRCRTRSRACGT